MAGWTIIVGFIIAIFVDPFFGVITSVGVLGFFLVYELEEMKREIRMVSNQVENQEETDSEKNVKED